MDIYFKLLRIRLGVVVRNNVKVNLNEYERVTYKSHDATRSASGTSIFGMLRV